VQITLGELRSVIRRSLIESGGAVPHFPEIRDTQSPLRTDREPIQVQKATDIFDDDEIAPHLRVTSADLETDDDVFGPVPPKSDNDPYALMDPYTSDWHVIPSPRFSR